MKIPNLAYKSMNRGLSLTETLLVLGVIALVAVIAYNGYNAALAAVKVSGETQAIAQLHSNISKTFGNEPNYDEVSSENIINASLTPNTFRVQDSGGTKSIINVYGGEVEVGPEVVGGKRYKITYNLIPAESCVEFSQSTARFSQELHINEVGDSISPSSSVKTAEDPAFKTVDAINLCSGLTPKVVTSINP